VGVSHPSAVASERTVAKNGAAWAHFRLTIEGGVEEFLVIGNFHAAALHAGPVELKLSHHQLSWQLVPLG